ncbi:MAG: right-handed parallel beta-helix repeat-containing protein [Lachnospiraceae bacterium]|nr:right-handed parallel beta-helix repeat-containing protein [Lachnospiraceae bacterium]
MKNRNVLIIRIFSVTLSALICLSALAGCGKNTDTEQASDTVSQTADTAVPAAPETSGENEGAQKDGLPSSDTQETTAAENGYLEGLEGKWEMVYTLSHSEYGTDEPYDSCSMASDPYSATSELYIENKYGKLIADYLYEGYESTLKYLGNELVERKGAAYEGCENSDFYLVFSDPFAENGDEKKYTLLEDGKLIGVSESTDGKKGTDDYYYYRNIDVYLKKDAPEMKNKEELRYFETVTVSSLEELINNMDSNKKVILKDGTYDFSALDKRYIDDDHKKHLLGSDEIEDGYRTYTISDLSNFCIEAEHPGKVLICTREAYDPVMFFRYSNNLTLRGLVCGHEVEPGYCSGSVIGFEGGSGITVDSCSLYGCGTYGIELHGCDHVNVTGSEIYECTYGLLDIYDSSDLDFENCTFRDSKDMTMICIQNGTDIMFRKCTFKDNHINPSYSSCYFVDLSEYSDAVFEDCTFEDNEYDLFSNRKVTQKNCTVNDNSH